VLNTRKVLGHLYFGEEELDFDMRESFIILIYVDILIILVLWNLIRDDMG
jgi:hypothetical protein